jgi:hypothetical protein
MNKSQQMRWSRHGADLLLQVRCAVYNGAVGSGFGCRFDPEPCQRLAMAAWSPQILDSPVMLHAARQIEGDLNILAAENGMLQGGGILPIIGHGGAVETIQSGECGGHSEDA